MSLSSLGGSKLGAPTNPAAAGPATGSLSTVGLFGPSEPIDYKSNISGAESAQLKLKLFEESAEVKEKDKILPDKEVSIENKNKFFEMLKKITPETTPRHLDRRGAKEDEESKNVDAKSEISEPS